MIKEKLKAVFETLERARVFSQASSIVTFDMETICPPKAMVRQGEIAAHLSAEAYGLIDTQEFRDAVVYLHDHAEDTDDEGNPVLSEMEKVFVENAYKEYLKNKNVNREKNLEWTLISSRSYGKWIEAKSNADFSMYAPTLEEVTRMNIEKTSLREDGIEDKYDSLLSDYDFGVTQKDLDEWFGLCKERLLPFMKKIAASNKTIRKDFLGRPVDFHHQSNIARRLLETVDYDFERGSFTTTEHPFTSDIAMDDIRVTTHYNKNSFASNIYSVVHEAGHALFGQLQPKINYEYFLESAMTMGMHESVSRFYENRIGRSMPFIELIYPMLAEETCGALDGVSVRDFYEAVNAVEPSLIRIDADEFTYTFHIIIRYEIEKALMNGTLKVADVPRVWAEKYEEYLGVRPSNDAEGALQDVHWTWGYGYFPAYAVGNMYNAMYYNRMKNEIDIDGLVRGGDFKTINKWMTDNVFAKACYMTPKEWIKDICGREMTPNDFIEYLETKFGELYGIS